MKRLTFFPIFLLLALSTFYCQKNSSGPADPDRDPGQLQIVKNPSLANNKDALQGIYTTKDNAYKGYYYGTFNSKGEPDSIKQMVINKAKGDTAINIFFDKSLRIKSLYLTYSGIKANSLIAYDYSVAGKTKIKFFNFDFGSNNSKLIYEYTVDNTSKAIVDRINYASFGSGFLPVLLQLTTTSAAPDPWMSQVLVAQGAIKALDLIVIGVGAIGCTISLPACIAGAIAVAYVGTNAANASTADIPGAPANSPQSPNGQTQNTQLQKTNYFVGTSPLYSFNYGGGVYCNLVGEYSNINVDIKINKSTNSILSCQAFAIQKETKVDPTCAPTSPVIPVNQHRYQYSSGQVTGNTVLINFATIAANPYSLAQFTGTMSGGVVNGTFKITRSDGVPGTLQYALNIPIVLKLI